MVGGASSIDAVELDPLVVDLVQQRFGSFSGRPNSALGVRVHIGEARGFVARRAERFDLIAVALLDAFGASSAGLHALAESTLSRFFRWQTLPELLALEGQGSLALLERGHPVLVATLLQALAASALPILLPLVVQARHGGTRGPAWRTHGRIAVHFGALGLAFMFVEIAFIQRFILVLAHPLTAVAVVLCAFLVFAAPGRQLFRLGRRGDPRHGGAALPRLSQLAVVFTRIEPVCSRKWLIRNEPDCADACSEDLGSCSCPGPYIVECGACSCAAADG